MRQRGRKSAANLVTLNVTGTSPRLLAPAYLRDDERTLFDELIARMFAKSLRRIGLAVAGELCAVDAASARHGARSG